MRRNTRQSAALDPPRLSNTISPSISTRLSSGGVTSTRMDCPAGTHTVSPARGGSWYCHVVSADQRSRYRKKTVDAS